MFKQLKNIDTAFKHVRFFSMLFLVCNVTICCFTLYQSSLVTRQGQQRIYLLLNGKLMDAYSINRSDSIAVEIKDHVATFHSWFYSLQPDEEINKRHITKALYLADNSAKQQYDNLTEDGYYASIISGNISQEVQEPDSIVVNVSSVPWHFTYYGKLRIIRATSILTRSLITQGDIRDLKAVSTHNPHGFLIEHWKILENKDLAIEKR